MVLIKIFGSERRHFMPKIDELLPIARWNAYILFVIDTSDDLSKGNRADILNLNMQEMVEALRETARHNSDINLKIAILTYNTDCHWLTENGPENVVNFVWRNPKTGGSANLGNALRELNHKLSLRSWVKSRMRYATPTIVFVSGSSASDDWKSELNTLQKNDLFRLSTKIGFSIGDSMSNKILAAITGTSETVIDISHMELFRNQICRNVVKIYTGPVTM